MKKSILCIIWALLIGLSTLSSAKADLILQVNPFNQTVTMTGTDTGMTRFVPEDEAGVATWALPGGGSTGQQVLNFSGAVVPSSGALSVQGLFVSGASGGLRYEFSIQPYEANQIFTLSGTGMPISYAGLNAVNLAQLESSVGSLLPTSGDVLNTFHPISIVSVPEPASLLLFALCGLIGLLRHRSPVPTRRQQIPHQL